MNWEPMYAVLQHHGVSADPEGMPTLSLAKEAALMTEYGYKVGQSRFSITAAIFSKLPLKLKRARRLEVAMQMVNAYDHYIALPPERREDFVGLIANGVTVRAAALQLPRPIRTKEQQQHWFADDPAPSQDTSHPFYDPEWE